MRRIGLVILTLLLLVGQIDAQDHEPPQVVVPGPPITPWTAVVVDASGSMRGGEYERAIAVVSRLLRQPIDEWYIRPYVFAERCYGLGDWHRLPDDEAVDRIVEKLGSRAPGGSTDIPQAIRAVSTENEGREALSILLVTDGRDSWTTEDLNEGTSGPLHIYGIETSNRSSVDLANLARITGGSFVEEPRSW